jgi:hypothetical protein
VRVAFLNRPAGGDPGGDRIAIDATMEALRRNGVTCKDFTGDYGGVFHADLAHIFHCNFRWSLENCELAMQAGKPYVVTPVFYPEDRGVTPFEIVYYLQRASAVLPFSKAEGEEMCKWLGEARAAEHGTKPEDITWDLHGWIPYKAIPNGTDYVFHAADGGPGRRGVCVAHARRGDGKRWSVVEEACHIAQLPFTFIQGFSHEEMPTLYRSHKVFISVSQSERMSLVIGEALCSGCRVLATTANRGNEWYGSGLATVDPDTYADRLAELIVNAYECDDTDWNWMPNVRARQLTWDYVAQELIKVYEEALR